MVGEERKAQITNMGRGVHNIKNVGGSAKTDKICGEGVDDKNLNMGGGQQNFPFRPQDIKWNSIHHVYDVLRS